MSEGLKRFRRPAAWLVVLATVLLMAVDLVRLVLEFRGPLGAEAFGGHGLSLLNPVYAIVLVAAVACCAVLRPLVAGARALTVTALVVALTGALGQFCFGVIGLVRAGRRVGVLSAVIDAVGYLAFSVVPVVAVVALFKILGGLRREELRRIEAQELTVELPRPSHPAETPEIPETPETAGQQEATWRPDAASGAAWQSAGAAAAGAQASGWGRPGERGWTPVTREPAEPAEPAEPGEPEAEHPEPAESLRREPPRWQPRRTD